MTTESPRWLKSSYSDNGGACVEVATNLSTTHGTVAVRDSKNLNGPILTLAPDAWTELVQHARQTAA
ncbi:DUF397 domain-containing protein [Streptomyces chrestomyceticus]|uniref:DUF397 domain-containing protein n=1 Tax=Streptomyces chrestomyceticus TaxID=68185 RepID=UPI0037B062F1